MRGCERDAGRKGLLRAEKRATRRDAARRGERRAYREAESGHGQRAAGNMQHECMRGALGNDIGIMAEHGTNEMTNGPTDWNRGPEIGAPSKEGHGVIIQANKGRSHQDYRVPRAAPHPVAPGPPSLPAAASPLFVRNYRAKLLSVASPSIFRASPVRRDATR